MASYSYTVAIVMPSAELGCDPDPREIATTQAGDEHRFVYTHSRRGAVFSTLQNIFEHSSIGTDFYILKDSAILEGEEICRAADSIQALITAIEHDPNIVLEATKTPHHTTTEIYLDGFEPLSARIVYPEGATIKDGWVYLGDRSEVLAYLRSAESSSDPCPSYDDEGEGLEYAFGVLKSHLSLLRFATESGFAFVFAELNEDARDFA